MVPLKERAGYRLRRSGGQVASLPSPGLELWDRWQVAPRTNLDEVIGSKCVVSFAHNQKEFEMCKWRREWTAWQYGRGPGDYRTVTYVTNGDYSIFRQPFGPRNGMVYCVCEGKPGFDSGWNFAALENSIK